MIRVAIIPSNQHLNQYAGLPGVTEEKWAAAVCAWVQRRLNKLGAQAGLFHVPGAGSKSTDELAAMLKQAVAWRPDYMLSVHSDAVGDKRLTGILMLVPWEQERARGRDLGERIARAVGLPYRGAWVYGNEARKLNYLYTLRLRGISGSLVEVGEHATAAEAAWNWRHIREIGEGIADALADHLGIEQEDEAMRPEELTRLNRSRVSDIKQSYEIAILNAQVKAIAEAVGVLDWPPEVADLAERRDHDVAAEKAKLGL